MSMTPPPKVRSKSDPEYQAWLDEIITLPEAAVLRTISVDTLRRMGKNGQIKLIRISPGRVAITRREALRGLRED